MAIYVTDSKSKGLQISVDVNNLTLIVILESLLASANVLFVKSQVDPWRILFKVDAAGADTVRNLIAGWYTQVCDIQYAMDTRQQSS